MALGVHNTFLDPHRAGLVGLALAVDVDEAFYLSFGHVPPGEPTLAFESPGIGNLPELRTGALAALVDLLEDPGVEKVGADLKALALSLAREGVCLRGMTFDVTIASYVLDPGRRKHDLEALCQDFLDFSLTPYNDVIGTGQKRISFSEVEQEKARDYAGQGVDAALRLTERFTAELAGQGLAGLFAELEMPLVPVLVGMEQEGIRIDPGFFQAMSGRLERDLTLIRDEIYKVAGAEFNLNSTPQLREVLFEQQGLPVIKRTKTGPSTDSSVLEELAAEGHEIPRLMMEYRESWRSSGRPMWMLCPSSCFHERVGSIPASIKRWRPPGGFRRVIRISRTSRYVPSWVGRFARDSFLPTATSSTGRITPRSSCVSWRTFPGMSLWCGRSTRGSTSISRPHQSSSTLPSTG